MVIFLIALMNVKGKSIGEIFLQFLKFNLSLWVFVSACGYVYMRTGAGEARTVLTVVELELETFVCAGNQTLLLLKSSLYSFNC